MPILSGVQLASHEFGHFATTFLPQVLSFMGGSLFEIIMPLGLAAVFLWQTRDLLGVSVCLAWAAASCASVATYIADAPFQQLALIGGEHDWAFILSPEGLDAMGSADAIAAFVRGLGVVFLLAGFAAALAGPWWVRRRDARDARERALAATPAPLPATSAVSIPQAPNPEGWAVVPPWESGSPQEPEAGGKPEP